MTHTTISVEDLKDRVERCHFATYRVGGAKTIHLTLPYPQNFPALCGVRNNLKDAEFRPEYGHRLCVGCLKASHILDNEEKGGLA